MQLQFVIYSGSFAKAAKIEILNVKTFSSAVADISHNIGVVKYFAKIQKKTLVLKSPFNKVKARNFIKKGLQHMCFSVSLKNF